ncbi:MAG: hypothetical protein GF320_21915 [Armatimonadia bacterium]|nr:hypothetical protein [Armatimonadia bacterium]
MNCKCCGSEIKSTTITIWGYSDDNIEIDGLCLANDRLVTRGEYGAREGGEGA